MNTVKTTMSELLQAVERMRTLVDATPEDRLFWKPSATSRSIAEVVAHAAHALANIEQQMRGVPYPIKTSAEANRAFLEHDRQFTERGQLLRYLQERTEAYVAFVDSLTPDDLERMAPLPFGLGEGPLWRYIEAGPSHTKGHLAQIEYIQTLYGDHDWHWGF